MSKPTIYGFCPAGCKYPVTTKDDFDSKILSIEERLTRLGFREGVATFSSDALTYLNEDTSYIKLYRQGNYVILKGKLDFKDKSSMGNFFTASYATLNFFTIPNDFLPSSTFDFFIGGTMKMASTSGYIANLGLAVLCTYQSDGLVIKQSSNPMTLMADEIIDTYNVEFSVGYEATPIE